MDIDKILFSMSQDELKNVREHRKMTEIKNSSFTLKNGRVIIRDSYFLNDRKVYISKCSRFADYPEHGHSFLEMNYVYSGSSNQTVNGQQQHLNMGDLLLMSKNTVHAIAAPSREDIIINLMFPVENFDASSLGSIMHYNAYVFDFLMHNMTSQDESTYMIFRSSKYPPIQQLLRQIMEKYYSDSYLTGEIIRLEVTILFMELIESVPIETYREDQQQVIHDPVLRVLQMLRENAADLTLEETARELGYNRNYLGSLIKKRTGRTFKEVQTDERLNRAHFLAENTQLPMDKIITMVGWSNKTYFYKKYRTRYGCLPRGNDGSQ